MTRLFVGGLNYQTTEQGLKDFFEGEGYRVTDASVVMDKITNRSRGFGFVTLELDGESSDDAIGKLNKSVLDGRTLTVNVAAPKPTPKVWEDEPGRAQQQQRYDRDRSGRDSRGRR